MLSLRELLAYGKVFMEEESQDSGNEWDLEGVDRWEGMDRWERVNRWKGLGLTGLQEGAL